MGKSKFTWDWGSLNSFGIKVPGYEWDELNPSTVSRQAVEERYLSGSPLVSICVRVELRGEEYHRYEAKYGNTYTQSPSIPSSWLMEGHGGSSGGPTINHGGGSLLVCSQEKMKL